MTTARAEELRTLTDSITGNANAARTVIALLLLLSLYLFLTLVASTGRNLLLDGQVALPQLGVGLAVSISYVLAPPVFLYLHIHALSLLATLARQMRTYNALVRAGVREGSESAPALPWNWLSSFPFVQMYVPNTGTALVSRSLVWLTVFVTPLVLLTAIDLSFLRYQSWPITIFHHSILVLDFLIVRHFLTRFRWGLARRSPARQLRAVLVRHLRRRMPPLQVRRVCVAINRVRYVPSLCILLLFVAYANPPRFHIVTYEDDREHIWGESELGFWRSALSGYNVLDAGPCEWWGLGCRFLDVREGPRATFDGSSISEAELSPRGRHGIEGLNLARRNFRFARLYSVHLSDAGLRHTDFRGAELNGSVLRRADLAYADLSGVRLHRADLQGAILLSAKLNAADLRKADLRGTEMTDAKLMGTRFDETQLAGADMRLACLVGSTLVSAGLQGVNLSGAYLQGADLNGAMLHGANIEHAKLHAADLAHTAFDGANLRGVDLTFTTGVPLSLHLTLLDNVTFDSQVDMTDPDYRSSPHCPSDLWTLKSHSHLDQTIEEHIQYRQMLANKGGLKLWNWRTIWNERNCTPMDRTDRSEGSCYWREFRKWTVEFACKNQFTALSTLRRWERLNTMDTLSVPVQEWRSIRKTLASQRRSKSECLGLASLPERLWESYMLDWD